MEITIYGLAALATILIFFAGAFLLSDRWYNPRPGLLLLFIVFVVTGGAVCLKWLQEVIKDEAAAQSAPPAKPAPTPALESFSVSISTVISPGDGARAMSSPFWYSHTSRSGETLSPVSIILFIQLVNNQQVPSMIESYSAEARNRKGEWIRLQRISTRRGAVFRVNNNDFSRALRIDLGANGFDNLIADRSIPPHETVRGWAFFAIPEDIAPNGSFRIRVRDTAGREATSAPRVEPDPDTAQLQTMRTQEAYDISRLPKKFYSE